MIRDERIRYVLEHPERTQVQSDARIRKWALTREVGMFLRVFARVLIRLRRLKEALQADEGARLVSRVKAPLRQTANAASSLWSFMTGFSPSTMARRPQVQNVRRFPSRSKRPDSCSSFISSCASSSCPAAVGWTKSQVLKGRPLLFCR